MLLIAEIRLTQPFPTIQLLYVVMRVDITAETTDMMCTAIPILHQAMWDTTCFLMVVHIILAAVIMFTFQDRPQLASDCTLIIGIMVIGVYLHVNCLIPMEIQWKLASESTPQRQVCVPL